jgi:hypothetical protein
LKPLIIPRLVDPEGKGTHRIIISTPLAESAVAPFLTQLAAKVEPKGIKVGSYPRWGKKRNTVTLVGRYVFHSLAQPHHRMASTVMSFSLTEIHRDEAYLDSIVKEVEEGVLGRRVSTEGEDDTDNESNKP